MSDQGTASLASGPPEQDPCPASVDKDRELRELIDKVLSTQNSDEREGAELWPSDASTRTYQLPGTDGEHTLAELVVWAVKRDPKFNQIKRKALPTAFWNLRRRVMNRRRTLRDKTKRKEDQRSREAQLSHLTEEERAQLEAERRQRDVQAHLEQQKRFDDGMAGGMDLVVDCKFSEGLNDREIRSLCKQLQYSYGFNRRSARPVRLHFTSFTGPVKDVADRWMSGQNWPVHKSEQGALDLFPRERIVVLSPDAEEPLLEVDPSKVYVVGGLVDRTVQKGATLAFAEQGGVGAVRLPIPEFLPDEAGRQAHGKARVLNVHDVVGALLAVHGGEGWKEALLRAIPQRKRGPEAQLEPAPRRPPAPGSAGSQGAPASQEAPAGEPAPAGGDSPSDNAAPVGGEAPV